MRSVYCGFILGSSSVLAVPLKAQTVGGALAAPPAAVAQLAVQACEAHVRAGIPASSGTLSRVAAGAEQAGFVLVTGQVDWRSLDGERSPFACVYERAPRTVAAAAVPSPPPPSPVGAALRQACLESVVRQVKAQHDVTPTFEGVPALGRTSGGLTLSGSGSWPSARATGTRAAVARNFEYTCLIGGNEITRTWFTLSQ